MDRSNINIKVAAVIVTYNRLSLLKECVAAVQSQTHKLDQIIVINNGSTDGTAEWLEEQPNLLIITQENLGGSGGFFTGMKDAYDLNVDFLWLMDDDTIPSSTALEYLLFAKPQDWARIGFVCSTVKWIDGNLHGITWPTVLTSTEYTNDSKEIANRYSEEVTPIRCGPFVSILIKKDVVRRVGLPYKKFYIWYDDTEYTTRILKAGFVGVLSKKSVAVHKTPSNHGGSLIDCNPKEFWKYKYGLRNITFCAKKDGIIPLLRKLVRHLISDPIKILKNSQDLKWQRVGLIYKATIAGIFFNDKIVYLK
jgi:rhamnopyranosyl-N-acetylglucosaminyl-diphospho-decaprenol beta-1,3/1,4-galactofuranosyltransferase